jgi:hypothetical protein
VGKTSLLHRLADNVFSTGWMVSIGVDFRIKTIDVQGLRIKLQGTRSHNFGRQPRWDDCSRARENHTVWDSQPVYQRTSNMARMYYRCASVMVVYDITSRESFHNVRNWVATFRENCSSDDGEPPVFLIGTPLPRAVCVCENGNWWVGDLTSPPGLGHATCQWAPRMIWWRGGACHPKRAKRWRKNWAPSAGMK